MIKKILSGYSKLLISFFKITGVAALCAFCAAAVVFPLWKFATAKPGLYTFFILAVLFIAVVLSLFFRLKKSLKAENTAEKTTHTAARKIIRLVGKILVIAVGLFFLIFFLLHGHAVAAVITAAALIIIYGILAFGFETQKTASPSPEDNQRLC